MQNKPTKDELRAALAAAGQAHHDYETNFLGGVPDEDWAGWYAAYVVGRLRDFTTPTSLTTWLDEVSTDRDWAEAAAIYVANKLEST